jgi:signal transduction histidine kinase
MRRRILVAIVAVTAIAVAAFALPLGIAVGHLYRDDELTRLERTATAATLAVDVSAGERDPIELPHGGSTAIAYYDRRGVRMSGSGPASSDDVVREVLRTGKVADERDGGQLVVAVPVASGERVAGVMRAARSDAALGERVRNARLLLAGLGCAIVLGAGAAALVLSRRLTRPLDRLATSAERLGRGDFSVRAPHAGVPELDAVGNALDTTAQRLDEMVGRERSFSADASHQLRTPLAALRLELEAAQLTGDGLDGAATARALEQTERLDQTIDALLAIARDERRSHGPLDVVAMLEELADEWRGPLAEKGRAIRLAVESDVPAANADGVVIRHVLEVLLDNATHHGAGQVTLSARGAGDGLAIQVADEGEGLKADPESYFARRSDTAVGHGIGLALARSLATAEGGRLTLDRAAPPVFTVLLKTG